MIKRELCRFILSFLLFLPILARAETEKTFIGDEPGGNRSIPVHLIPFLDEDGQKITPLDEISLPFSTAQTCGNDCHNYDRIRTGRHFNSNIESVKPGRNGEPWIFIDGTTGTQVPMSYRSWTGTFQPTAFGLSNWDFLLAFGHHMTGGGVGEFEKLDDPAKGIRLFVSGNLEVNCLSCHDADPRHDQSEYTMQVLFENFRWAAAATAGFAFVEGAARDMPDTFDHLMPAPLNDPKKIPPSLVYRENTFDYKERVFFDIVKEAPKERCYFCHTVRYVGENPTDPWTSEEDIHIAAGLTCVDCHRNGIDHDMLRGYENESEDSNNPLASVVSCQGCHSIDENTTQAEMGRLGAPVPKHAGIPPDHFEKLSCTACHSGPKPKSRTQRVRTSRAHILGIPKIHLPEDAPPHIVSPVYAKNEQDKIYPQHLIWPAYWGVIRDGHVTPIPMETVKQAMSDLPNENEDSSEMYISLTADRMKDVLNLLSNVESIAGEPVYISGGNVYRMGDGNELISETHHAGRPYMWPLAHNVRPAVQSLGSDGCTDCHSIDASFCVSEVEVDTPFITENYSTKKMHEFLAVDPVYMDSLAYSFQFRVWAKVVLALSCGIIIAVLLLYGSRMLAVVCRWFSKTEKHAG